MRFLVFLCLLLFSSGAHAEWLQASGAHFVVYANDSERNIRRLAEQLERYDAALATRTIVHRDPTSPSNRITVYVVDGAAEVRRLLGAGSGDVAGFNIARAGNSMAVIPRPGSSRTFVRVENSSGPRPDLFEELRYPLGRPTFEELDLSIIVLLHEYAHYFIRSMGGFPEPRWLSEGAAEFFSTARFDADGGVELGQPAKHRMAELSYANDLTVTDLLDPAANEKRKAKYKGNDAFYGMSWLFYHYLAFNKARAGQIRRYGDLLQQGKPLAEAALEAFGDFKQLQRELNRYLMGPAMPTATLPASILPIGPIEVRKLGAGEAAMMSIRIRVHRGVNKKQAAKLLPEARTIAARFPGEAAILTTLAQVEYEAGNDTQAIAAANSALAIDRTQVNAYVQKGLALLRIAEKADDKAAAFDAARAPFEALSLIEPNNPVPMVQYYRSFVLQKVEPPQAANRALAQAVTLAPFDMSLRMTLATQQLRYRRRDLARINLLPVAYDPHGGPLAEQAKQALERIDGDIIGGRSRRAERDGGESEQPEQRP